MSKADNWVHYNPNILNVGRLTHMDPEVPEGDETEPEELKRRIEAADPYEPRLKAISKDQAIPIGGGDRVGS